ncbi:MAG: PRC-barrel domain-containing protein [Pseudorhizobium sp.]
MHKTLSIMAAAAALMATTAIAPAMGQTANPATPAAPSAPADPAMTPSDGTSAAPAASGTTSTGMATGSGSYLTEQSETQISANDYIGKSVYNSEGDSIGDVNDLILEEQGGIAAAVIGVGGFLGIGEKDVAVPMDKLTMTRDVENNNEVRISTIETLESLQAAPEFLTLADRQAAADAAATDASTTSATGTAPMPDSNATTPSTAQPNN